MAALLHRFGYSVIRPGLAVAPGATLAVYLTGTVTLASIFADVAGVTPLANPLTTDVNAFYSYYADPATGDLDERFSGTGIASPYTLTAVLDLDPRVLTALANTGTVVGGSLQTQITAELAARALGDLNLQKAGVRYQLEGSILVGQTSASRVDAIDAAIITIDGSRFPSPYVLTVFANVKTDSAGTSVTPVLRNITTGADAGTGAASVSLAPATQSFVAVIAAGVNTYKLQLIPGNANAAVYGEGLAQLAA